MIRALLALIRAPQRPPEADTDPYGIEAALAKRKRLRLDGYVRPYRKAPQ